jgi:hypothetical protein
MTKNLDYFSELSKKTLNSLLYNKSYIRSRVLKKKSLLLLDNYHQFIVKKRVYKKKTPKRRFPYIKYTGLDLIASKKFIASKTKIKRKFVLKKGFSIHNKITRFSGNFKGFIVSFFWQSVIYNSSLKVLTDFNKSLCFLRLNQKTLWFLKPKRGGFTVYSQGIFGFMSKRNALISILIVTVYFIILYRFRHYSKKLRFLILKLFKKRKSLYNKRFVFRFIYKDLKVRLVSFKKVKKFSKSFLKRKKNRKLSHFRSNIQIFFTVFNKPEILVENKQEKISTVTKTKASSKKAYENSSKKNTKHTNNKFFR